LKKQTEALHAAREKVTIPFEGAICWTSGEPISKASAYELGLHPTGFLSTALAGENPMPRGWGSVRLEGEAREVGGNTAAAEDRFVDLKAGPAL